MDWIHFYQLSKCRREFLWQKFQNIKKISEGKFWKKQKNLKRLNIKSIWMKVIKTISLKGFGKKYQGKVRDYYIVGDRRIIATTDRISAFDVILGLIPGKGAVLNQLSAFWFEKTKDIIQNHLISTPHPNVMIVKNAKLIPIEMVVRGYITGVTGTSIWGSYEKGE